MQTIELNSYRDVIALFDSLVQLSDATGAGYTTVCQWRYRDRIPCQYWRLVIAALADQGVVGMSVEVFLDFEEE